MAFWIDDFDGNNLSSKWVITQLSRGGVFTGSVYRQIKDSKAYWRVQAAATESNYWGQRISLVSNWAGDLTIELSGRQKMNGDTLGIIGIGLNESGTGPILPDNGVAVYAFAVSTLRTLGTVATTAIPVPSRPSATFMYVPGYAEDLTFNLKLVRRNGVMFLYCNNLFLGRATYNNVITSIDFNVQWYANAAGGIANEKWIDYIKIWPREAVL